MQLNTLITGSISIIFGVIRSKTIINFKNTLLFIFIMQGIVFAESTNDNSYNQFISEINKDKTFKVDFQQSKTVKGLNKKLNSSGNIYFSFEKGIVWSQIKPFTMRYSITEDWIYQKINDKHEKIPTQDNPFTKLIFTLFNGLFSGDTELLENTFDIDTNQDNDRITLLLVPLDKNIGKHIKSIQIEFIDIIRKIIITETFKNRTIIIFSNKISIGSNEDIFNFKN